jgi:hypothetical protein
MITAVAWRDDANTLATSSEDGTLRLFEMENGTQTKSWPAHPGGAACVRVAHDGRLVSTGRDKVTKLWDAAGAQQKVFTAFKELGLQAAITHDASRVVASDWNGYVMVSKVEDGALQASLDADPLTPGQRAERAATLAEAAVAIAKQKAADTKAALDKSVGELAALTKIHTDATAADKAAKDAVAAAVAEVGRLAGGMKSLQAEETAKAAAHAALNDAAVKVQDAAGKVPASPELKAHATKAADLAKSALADLEATRKTLATATASHKAAEAKHAELQKAAAAPAAKLADATAKLTAAQNAAKPLKDALTSAEAALVKATADRDAAKKAAEAIQKK